MTGRDLVIYILQNNLEDKPVFEDGKLLGFMNVGEAALKWNVGTATIKLWFEAKVIDGFKIGDEIYIPINTDFNIIALLALSK